MTETEFIQQLDETPDDWGLRLIYADWLEEQGDSFCETQRWMAENEVCPYNLNTEPASTWFSPWTWYREHRIVNRRVASLPCPVYDELLQWYFETRHEAELALHDALQKSGVITATST